MPADLGLELRSGAGVVEQQAVKDFNVFYRERTGNDATGSAFRIVSGVMDEKGCLAGRPIANAGRLKTVPNFKQGYVIQPGGTNRLLIAAWNERGVYYGVQSLRQLLEAKITKAAVSVPLAVITDWPDFDERGTWNYATTSFDAWYASLKLNFVCCHVRARPTPIRRDAAIGISSVAPYMDGRRARAFNPVFSITHLNFLDRQDGLYAAYPELAGQGARAWQKANPHPKHRVPCASNPLLAKVLAEMLADGARQGAREMSVWLSEFNSQCECAACLKAGQAEAETQAALDAWREVRKQYPDFKLRLFYAIAPERNHRDEYFKNLPIDVKLERCGVESRAKAGKPRHEFFNPGFDDFAARGGWVASYDVQVRTLFCPQQIRDFIRQLCERHWQAAIGFGPFPPRDEFMINALAEWTWNINGRTEKEMAAAWATRRGYSDPDGFAAWVELIGSIHWDIATTRNSDVLLRNLASKIKNRPAVKVDPSQYPDGLYLAGSSLEYFPTRQSFDEKIAIADKALALASTLQPPATLSEVRRTQGQQADLAKTPTAEPNVPDEMRKTRAHLIMLKNMYVILDAVYTADTGDPAVKQKIQDALQALRTALAEQGERQKMLDDAAAALAGLAPAKPAQ